MAKTEIRVSGLGGQGVILCATIIGKAASNFQVHMDFQAVQGSFHLDADMSCFSAIY